MREDRWDGDEQRAGALGHARGVAVGEGVESAGFDAGGQLEADLLGTDRQEFAHGAFHHHWVREVHEVDGERVTLAPDGDDEDAGTGDGDERVFVRGPADGVGQEFRVVGVEGFPEGAAEVAGEIDDAAAAAFAEIYLGDVGFWRVSIATKAVSRCAPAAP